MVKRDRWDSSSSDEEDEKKKKKKPSSNKDDSINTTNNTNKQKTTSSLISSTSTKNKIYPIHNPLLNGCRSVYDTYERISHVSEGTYGIVWKARDLITQDIVALKQIKFDNSIEKEGFPITALREINVLLSLNHENIVTTKEMVIGKTHIQTYMVMEYFEFDLKDGLTKFHDALAQSELKSILYQILSGIQYMHSKWLLHRDLKTSNILVHRSGRVAICDLGLTKHYQYPQKQPLTQLVVTLWYRSPELLFGENKYGPSIDMWSIGCIFGGKCYYMLVDFF